MQWKVLVLDPDSKRLIENVLDQDTILNENITSQYTRLRLATAAERFPDLLQTSSRSPTDDPLIATLTPYTSSPRNHTSLTASWQTLRSGNTDAHIWCGLHVSI